MENLAVITALNHKGSFGKYFVKFKRKKKLLFSSQGRSILGETVDSVFSTITQDFGHAYFGVLCLKEHAFTH